MYALTILSYLILKAANKAGIVHVLWVERIAAIPVGARKAVYKTIFTSHKGHAVSVGRCTALGGYKINLVSGQVKYQWQFLALEIQGKCKHS